MHDSFIPWLRPALRLKAQLAQNAHLAKLFRLPDFRSDWEMRDAGANATSAFHDRGLSEVRKGMPFQAAGKAPTGRSVPPRQ